MIWQEKWVHLHAYGFWKRRGATDAAALIALLIELHTVMRAALKSFGLDYVKCFDLIPQQVCSAASSAPRRPRARHAHRHTRGVVRNVHTADPLF